jgi:hypothetical protein
MLIGSMTHSRVYTPFFSHWLSQCPYRYDSALHRIRHMEMKYSAIELWACLCIYGRYVFLPSDPISCGRIGFQLLPEYYRVAIQMIQRKRSPVQELIKNVRDSMHIDLDLPVRNRVVENYFIQASRVNLNFCLKDKAMR